MISQQNNLKQRLKLRHNKTEEVLQELLEVFKNNNDIYNTVLILMGQARQIKLEMIQDVTSHNQKNQDLTKLHHRILNLIDLITPEEAAAYELENSIFQHILVVCKSKDREEFMTNLISNGIYKNVKYDFTESPQSLTFVNEFDLVIFDNYPHETTDDQHELLRYYLDKTAPYVLYFGKILPLLWKYPKKAYYATSMFSIHARIEEMITFIKYQNQNKQ